MITLTALMIYFFVQSKFNASEKAYNKLRERK